MESFVADIRFAFRQLLVHRAFTVVAALTLALGIGANTAIFSVMYGVLLRPLPYSAPDQLVGLSETAQGHRDEFSVMYGEYQFLAQRSHDFASFAAVAKVGMTLGFGDAADHVDGLRVSSNYFSVLAVAPRFGRNFTADEDVPAGPSVLIISDRLFQRRFGGDARVIGRTVELDGTAATIVGVMPPNFTSLPAADAWSTLAPVGGSIGSGENLQVIGRLRRGVSVLQADTHSQPVFADYRREFVRFGNLDQTALHWMPYTAIMAADVATPVRLLFGAIGFVLLIACANVASLLLGRTATRGRELAVRVALGANRARIIRQILTESIVLSLVGGVLSLVVASWGLHALLQLVPADLPRTGDVRIDGWALGFTFGVSLLTGIAFGAVPAWQSSRSDPQDTLRESGARTTGSARMGKVRDVLVTTEVALAIILLSGAGLMMRTLSNLVHTDAGFDPQRELAAEIWLTGPRYDSATAIAAFYRDVRARLQAVPGVQSAAVVEAGLPLQRGGRLAALVDGKPVLHNDYRTISPDYFRTLGVPMLEGRDFTDADDASSAQAVVVDQKFAHLYFDDHAIGQIVTMGSTKVARTVIGVVGNVHSFVGLDVQPTVYLPSAQTPPAFTRIFNGWFPIHILVRSAADPALLAAAVTRAIHATDPEVPVGRVRAMSSVLAQSLALQRFVMVLLTAFAALALTLAVVGIYGLVFWFVVRNTREIGVRVALGAAGKDVVLLVVGRGMLLASIGGVAGLAGSFLLTRLLAGMLFNVKPGDPGTLLAVAALLIVVAAVACYLPSRRAARLDPMLAMRAE